MADTPTQAQIEKLPQWAQKHIENLERERDAAIRALKDFTNENTPSGVYIADHPCLGEDMETGEKKSGCTPVRRYIQAKRVMFKLPRTEEEMEVFVNEQEFRVEIRCSRGYPLIEPVGGSTFYILSREDFYIRPNAQDLCRAVLDRDKLSHDDFVQKYGFSQAALEDTIRKNIPKSRLERMK